MAGFEDRRLFNDDPEIRRGGQAPEAYIGGFAVYGGTSADRDSLQAGDQGFVSDAEDRLRDILDGYGDEMFGHRHGDRSTGRTPFDDLKDGDEA